MSIAPSARSSPTRSSRWSARWRTTTLKAWSTTSARRNTPTSDPDIHLLSNLDGVGNVEVNAFQQAATVVLQKSLREGFGLTIAEGLWKGKPVIGGNVGGIPLQIEDGVTGFLVESVEEASAAALEIMRDPERAHRMGEIGREVVREKFLSTANLRNYLRLFTELMEQDASESKSRMAKPVAW